MPPRFWSGGWSNALEPIASASPLMDDGYLKIAHQKIGKSSDRMLNNTNHIKPFRTYMPINRTGNINLALSASLENYEGYVWRSRLYLGIIQQILLRDHQYLRSGTISIVYDQIYQPLYAELLLKAVLSLNDAVGIQVIAKPGRPWLPLEMPLVAWHFRAHWSVFADSILTPLKRKASPHQVC